MPLASTMITTAATTVANTVVNRVSNSAATSGMDALTNVLKALANATDGSLISVTESARVEPLCIIDSELNGNEALPSALQALQSIFTAYYLRAFAMTTNIGGVSVAGRLDPLSTSRNPINSFLVSNESYDNRLPFYDGSDAVANESVNEPILALEASGTRTDIGRVNDIQDASALAIGKVVNVKIEHNGCSAVVPISIRLACTFMNSSPVAGLLSGLGADLSLSERWQQLRHGGISFWRDFIMCQDIIDEHKKNLSEDKSGIYLAMMQQRAKNNAANVTSGGRVSLNNASNLVVVSRETLTQAELKLGISFDSFTQRQKIFENGYMMIILVMDRRWQRATFYTRGIKNTTTVSFKDLHSIEKSGGSDIGDILAAFRAGNAATL